MNNPALSIVEESSVIIWQIQLVLIHRQNLLWGRVIRRRSRGVMVKPILSDAGTPGSASWVINHMVCALRCRAVREVQIVKNSEGFRGTLVG